MSTWAEYLAELEAMTAPSQPAGGADPYSSDSFYEAAVAAQEEERNRLREAAAQRERRLATSGALPTGAAAGIAETGALEMAARSAAGGGVMSTGLAIGDLAMMSADTAASAIAGPDSRVSQWVDQDTDKLDAAVRRALGLGQGGTLTSAADLAAREARADYMAGGGSARIAGAIGGAAAPELLGGLGAGAILNRAAKKAVGEGAEMAARRALITGLADRGIDAAGGGLVTAAMGSDGGALGLDDAANFATGAGAGLVLGEGLRQGVGYLRRPAAQAVADAPVVPPVVPPTAAAPSGPSAASVIGKMRAQRAQELARQQAMTDGASFAPPPTGPEALGRFLEMEGDADLAVGFKKVTTAAKGAVADPLDPPATALMKQDLRRAASEINTAAMQVGGTERLGALANNAAAHGVDPLDHLDAPEMLAVAPYLANSPEVQRQLVDDAVGFAAGGRGSAIQREMMEAAEAVKMAKGIYGPQLSLEGQLVDPGAVAALPRAVSEEIKGRTRRHAAELTNARSTWQQAVKAYSKANGTSPAAINEMVARRTQYGPQEARKAVSPVIKQLNEAGVPLKEAKAQVDAAWLAMSTGDQAALQGIRPEIIQAMQASVAKWGIPAELQGAWLQSLKPISGLRETMLADGIFDADAAAVAQKRGIAYLYRDYDVNYDPVGQLEKAKGMPEYAAMVRSLNAKMPGLTPDEIMANVDAVILGRDTLDKMLQKVMPTGPGGKSTVARKPLNSALRKLKGERFNFPDNLAQTGWLMAEQKARHEVMQTVVATAKRLGVAQETPAPGRKPVPFVRGNEQVNSPTDGLYFREDVADALQTPLAVLDVAASLGRWAQFSGALGEGAANLMRASRSVKIVGNIPSMANQFIGDTVAALAGTPILARLTTDPKGSLRNFTMAATASLDAMLKGKVSGSQIAKLSNKAVGVTPEQLAETLRLAVDKGIVKSGALAELMAEVDPRRKVVPTPPRTGTSGDATLATGQYFGRALDKALPVAAKLGNMALAPITKPVAAVYHYGVAPFSDLVRVWGLRAYMDEVSGDLAGALKASGRNPQEIAAELARPENVQFVQGVAAEKMLSNMPTPSRAHEAVKKFDRYSPVNPWLVMQLEPLRNLKNIGQQVLQAETYAKSLASHAGILDDAVVREVAQRATRRAVGQALQVATAVGALGIWASAHQDEELPEGKALAVKNLVRMEFEDPATMAVTEYIPGVGVKVRNYGTTDVTEFPKRIWRIATESPDAGSAVQAIAREATSFQPAVEAALEAMLGRNVPGDLVTAMSRGSKHTPEAQRAAKPLETLMPGTAKRMLGMSDGLRRFDDSLYYDAMDANAALDRLRADARSEAAMVVDSAKIPGLKAKYDAQWLELLRTMHTSVDNARAGELPEADIQRVLKGGLNRLNERGKRAVTKTETQTSLWDLYRWEDFTAPPKARE